jgi:hypothetical protein
MMWSKIVVAGELLIQANLAKERGMDFKDGVLVRLTCSLGRSPTSGGRSSRFEQSDKSRICKRSHPESSSGRFVIAVDRKSSTDRWSNPPILRGISVIDLAFCKISSSRDVILPISSGSDCKD